jgi:hypothetical protein
MEAIRRFVAWLIRRKAFYVGLILSVLLSVAVVVFWQRSEGMGNQQARIQQVVDKLAVGDFKTLQLRTTGLRFADLPFWVRWRHRIDSLFRKKIQFGTGFPNRTEEFLIEHGKSRYSLCVHYLNNRAAAMTISFPFGAEAGAIQIKSFLEREQICLPVSLHSASDFPRGTTAPSLHSP